MKRSIWRAVEEFAAAAYALAIIACVMWFCMMLLLRVIVRGV